MHLPLDSCSEKGILVARSKTPTAASNTKHGNPQHKTKYGNCTATMEGLTGFDSSLQEIILKVNLESNLTRLNREYDMHLQKNATRAWMAPPLDERGVLQRGILLSIYYPIK
jgi:hypothetical protein